MPSRPATLAYVTVNLQVVVVDNGDEVIEARNARRTWPPPRPGPPRISPSPSRREDTALGATLVRRSMRIAKRHARGNRKALAERAGGDLDAGTVCGVGMALQAAVPSLRSVEQLVVGDVGQASRKRGVEHRRRMALREDEVIALRVLRVHPRIVVHHAAEVERRQRYPWHESDPPG